MRYWVVLLGILIFSCAEKTEDRREALVPFTKVNIEFLHTDSTSIRAIAINDQELMYAGSEGHYGFLNSRIQTAQINKGTIDFLGKKPSFRSIASTTDAFFMLSIESPALLYRYDKDTNLVKLVYSEENEKVFYDALDFWNDQEGIAMGDPTGDCLSILITRDGGHSWGKLECTALPEVAAGEAAFAASDTNIKIVGDHTWIVSGGARSRIFYSGDKGYTWTVYNTPIIQGLPSQGAYSMDFYDEQLGIIYGGDYTVPEDTKENIAITKDGGKSWKIVGSGSNDGYKSCVQYVPNSNGREIIASGFTGISYSGDGGSSWQQISEAPFLSFRFINDSTAYAGGRNAMAKVTFKR